MDDFKALLGTESSYSIELVCFDSSFFGLLINTSDAVEGQLIERKAGRPWLLGEFGPHLMGARADRQAKGKRIRFVSKKAAQKEREGEREISR